MASPVPAEISHAAYHRPIHGGHNPTPVKQPSQRTQHIITQVPESPSITQRPITQHASQKDSESIVHDSLEVRPSAPARPPPPNTLLEFLEQNVPIQKTRLVTESHQKQGVLVATNPPPSRQPIIAQSSIEAPLPDHPSSEDHAIEEDSIQLPPPEHLHPENKAAPQDSDKDQPPTLSQKQAVTANQTRANSSAHAEPDEVEEIQDFITVRPQPVTPPAKPDATRASNSPTSSDLNLPAANGFTTPSMPPKASKPKASTSASQKRKSATAASKKSSKPAPPLPDIVNQGETSAAVSLRQMKAGGNSQTNTTKQISEAVPETASRTRSSQKISARPSQATTNKSAAKLGPKLPIEKPSRRTEAPEGYGEYDLPPDPDVAEGSAELQLPDRDRSKSTKTTKTTAAPNKSGKGKPRKQAAKASDTDDDGDDKDYSVPKTNKSRGAITTRASTRAQTQRIARNKGSNVPTRNTTVSDVTRIEKRVSRKPTPSDREKIEDFEDSVTHINSNGADEPRLATQAQPAKRPAVKIAKPPTAESAKTPAAEAAEAPAVESAKPRRKTERETQLFNAISRPIQ
jgi:hypothetical protein